MPDVFSKKKRSEVMSHIRARGNKDTELAMIQILRKNKIIGWRRNQHVFGKPDFVFPRQKVALFIDGCFWHVCPDHCNFPKNNEEFWQKKLHINMNRDLTVNQTLVSKGWKVIRIWEHELKDTSKVTNRIITVLNINNVLFDK